LAAWPRLIRALTLGFPMTFNFCHQQERKLDLVR
jgi:hypothetical protein